MTKSAIAKCTIDNYVEANSLLEIGEPPISIPDYGQLMELKKSVLFEFLSKSDCLLNLTKQHVREKLYKKLSAYILAFGDLKEFLYADLSIDEIREKIAEYRKKVQDYYTDFMLSLKNDDSDIVYTTFENLDDSSLIGLYTTLSALASSIESKKQIQEQENRIDRINKMRSHLGFSAIPQVFCDEEEDKLLRATIAHYYQTEPFENVMHRIEHEPPLNKCNRTANMVSPGFVILTIEEDLPFGTEPVIVDWSTDQYNAEVLCIYNQYKSNTVLQIKACYIVTDDDGELINYAYTLREACTIRNTYMEDEEK